MSIYAFIIFFLWTFFSFVWSNPENVTKLSNLEIKLKENRAKLLPKIKEKKKATQSLNKIKRDVKYNQLKIKKIEKRLKVAKHAEKNAQKDYVNAKRNYNKSKLRLKNRLRLLHKEPNFSMLYTLLDTKLWSENIETTYFIERILQNDQQLIKNLDKNYKKIQEKKDILEKRTKEMQALKNDRQRRKKLLSKQK